jgi:hypothetical protein
VRAHAFVGFGCKKIKVAYVHGSKREAIFVICQASTLNSKRNHCRHPIASDEVNMRHFIILSLFGLRLHKGLFLAKCVASILLSAISFDEVIKARDYRAEVDKPKLAGRGF